jgi:hypothetical protein
MSAPDNSSHHIYLYGGIDPITGTGFDDVLILSLPSFTWTNVWPIGEAPRWGHNCHVAGKRQMITVGGNLTNGLECDWEVKGVAIFEMSTLTWGSVFMTNLTEYQVPEKILPLTGGTVNGGATKKDPALGWTDQGLKSVFATPRKATPSGPSPTPSATPGKSHTGAIAGGVVGGIAGLAIIAALGFFLLRRHRKKHSPHELHNNSSSTGGELGTEKNRHELQAVNENNPAELWGPEVRELESPRQAIETDATSRTMRVELPGTNTAPGGLHGVPIVRTPGDDLPEPPMFTPGLRRPSQEAVSGAEGRTTQGKVEEVPKEEVPNTDAQPAVHENKDTRKEDVIKVANK